MALNPKPLNLKALEEGTWTLKNSSKEQSGPVLCAQQGQRLSLNMQSTPS